MIELLWNWFLGLSNELKITVAVAVASSIGAIIYAVAKFIAWVIDRQKNTIEDKPSFNITLDQYETRLSERIDEAVKQRDTVHAEDRSELEAQITELRARLADPEKALVKAQETIKSLEDALDREGNDIGGDKLAEAKTALEAGDFSLADELFAQIEAREALAVKSAARAAFARGEIAEQEVRWHDASTHFQKAARLDPCYGTLIKAEVFADRSGDYVTAMALIKPLINAASNEFGNDSNELAIALNNHAGLLQIRGQLKEAESLFRQAVKITRKALGEEHQNYANTLNNLAGLLKITGRLEEAEPLYRQAGEITRKALGEEHPNYARDLNNLALLLEATGRLEEVETLHRQAGEITRKALSEEHPNYANTLNSLALLLYRTGRLEEAEPLFRRSADIRRNALGEAHPDYAMSLNNLAGLLHITERLEEAEPLFRQAAIITEKSLGAEHPSTILYKANLEKLLSEKP